jgi:hypothetical protein
MRLDGDRCAHQENIVITVEGYCGSVIARMNEG